MIRLTIKNGTQTIEARCNECGCYIKDLTVQDILVKGDTDAIVKDENGDEITRKDHEYNNCKCEHCDD
tara:strand:- start:427 stop:630 length:204 start_codon:yes stop_codon:yes gene_type:complete